jgi:peptidyl-prolyl cis-trans isomerase A (cyclophilin A)
MRGAPVTLLFVLASLVFFGCGKSDGTSDADPPTNAVPSPTGPDPEAYVPPPRDPNRYNGPDLVDRAEAAREYAHGRAARYPIVALQTSAGEIKLRLDREHAPITVANFLDYVHDGFYDGTIFHQVEKGFAIAGGGYTEQFKMKKTGASIRNEADNGLTNRKKTIAMVRFESIDSATSQFLINLADNADLDHKSREFPAAGEKDQYGYCVFGEVIDGWDVVEEIAKGEVRDTAQFASAPVKPVVIQSAREVSDRRETARRR